MARSCRPKKTNREQTWGQPIKCFKCGEHGHISKFCKQQKQEKNFVSQSRKFSQKNFSLRIYLENRNMSTTSTSYSFKPQVIILLVNLY